METYFRYCPVCATTTRHDTADQCRRCYWWERLHAKFLYPALSREYVLANTNDGTEYETSILEQEAV